MVDYIFQLKLFSDNKLSWLSELGGRGSRADFGRSVNPIPTAFLLIPDFHTFYGPRAIVCFSTASFPHGQHMLIFQLIPCYCLFSAASFPHGQNIFIFQLIKIVVISDCSKWQVFFQIILYKLGKSLGNYIKVFILFAPAWKVSADSNSQQEWTKFESTHQTIRNSNRFF